MQNSEKLGIEKLGTFYLGEVLGEDAAPILYDSKDLTTHAVIIGMTGSGKTGLGIGLIEEALLDGVPVIAVDPKGDLGNLLLNFPTMQTSDFLPWMSASEAEQAGKTVQELATEKRDLWAQGLEKSGQNRARMERLQAVADKSLYTPGASFGQPIALLRSFAAPNDAVRADHEAFATRVEAATNSLLALMQIEVDPLARETILLSQLFSHYWQQGQDLSIESLIAFIQKPPFSQIGVLDLETIFPEKERLKLAMQLNNLLASPQFSAWMQGPPLDAESLFYGQSGKPQLSVMNIAHLSESERIFFVTLLLSEILAWMRTQPGTGSLRAILYIDELFGYMPPLSNPSTKPLLLTLLKQARAYGLGLVLSTQNPVDLDYKGLSNTGTWFIGRLQTAQDRERVMAGLLSASDSGFDRSELNAAFDQLGKRTFLMHNIHESEPCIITTRWAMSYLAGPLSREQIGLLTPRTEPVAAADSIKTSGQTAALAAFPAGVANYVLPSSQVVTDPSQLVYRASLLASVNLFYNHSKTDTQLQRRVNYLCEFRDAAMAIDWRDSQVCSIDTNQIEVASSASFNALPLATVASRSEFYKDWEKSLTLWAKQEQALSLWQCEALKLTSTAEESEGDFRKRLQLASKEARDTASEALRQQFAKKIADLEIKQQKATQKVDKEAGQASGKTMDALLSAGSSLLGAFLGRKRLSTTTVRGMGTALRKAKGAWSERGDIDIAKAELVQLQQAMQTLEAEFSQASQALASQYDPEQLTLTEVKVLPKAGGVEVLLFGLAWQPGVLREGVWQAV